MSASVVRSDIAPEMDLAQCEAVIRAGLRTFVEVGRALTRVRDGKLYEGAGFKTFEEYASRRWGFGRSRAYQLIEAAVVAENVHNCGRDLTHEAHARELAKLPANKQREAWQRACETTPVDRVVTAAHVAGLIATEFPRYRRRRRPVLHEAEVSTPAPVTASHEFQVPAAPNIHPSWQAEEEDEQRDDEKEGDVASFWSNVFRSQTYIADAAAMVPHLAREELVELLDQVRAFATQIEARVAEMEKARTG